MKLLSKTKLLLISSGLIISLTSCYGPRLNKKNQALKQNDFIVAASSDGNIEAQLNYLIVKNDEFSWAKDAKWDEYIFNINNLSGEKITIQNITLIDSLGQDIAPETSRRSLIKKTKKIKKKYKKADIKIKLGHRSKNRVFLANVGGAAVTAGLAAGLTTSASLPALGAGSVTTISSSTAGAAGAAVILVPTIAVGGIMKIINNTKVNNQILRRQTSMPVPISARQNQNLDVFFPGTPSPKAIEIHYSTPQAEYTLVIDTAQVLAGLHYKEIEQNEAKLIANN